MTLAEPVVLIAEFTALQGQDRLVADLLAELAASVRQEPGNIAFDCYQRADDPCRFVVYEIYRDRQAFDAHIAADYGAVFNKRLEQLIVEPHSILTFLKPLGAP
jgi:quinol monooxygenase YgiN